MWKNLASSNLFAFFAFMSDDKKPDPLVNWATIVFILGAMLFGLWYVLGSQIASGTRWVRVAELSIVGIFTDKYEPLRQQLISLPVGQITFEQFLAMNRIVVGIFKYPMAGVLFILAWRCYFIDNSNVFTRKFNLENLIKEHAKMFPAINPITKFNPLKDNSRTQGDPIPTTLPSFAEALMPEEWISYFDVPLHNNLPDRDAIRRALLPQLGKRWQGPTALPPYAQALFAAFAMKVGGQRKESDDFLGAISSAWEPGRGLRLNKELKDIIREALQHPKQGRVLEKIAAQHAFVTTALLRSLQEARHQGGVLAPAQFLWLRDVDRALWYPLNNLGRNAVHTEACGAITHYRAELSAHKPIPNPQLEPAIEGIITYIKNRPGLSIPPKHYNAK
jgi:intracellular multiplication protein IcmP